MNYFLWPDKGHKAQPCASRFLYMIIRFGFDNEASIVTYIMDAPPVIREQCFSK